MKPLVAVLLTTGLSVSTHAQVKRPRLLIGANIFYANPQGSFGNAYNFGLGGELSAGIGMGKTFVIGSYGSSIHFAANENGYGNLSVKPIKIGIKQYLLANKLFVTGDVGTAAVKDKTMNTASSQFTRGIGAGVRLLGLEGGLYYNGWKSVHASGYSNNVQLKIGWMKIL
jgi:hypothetical protein